MMKTWKPNLPPFRKYKPIVFEKASHVSGFIYQIGESEILRKPSKDVTINKITSHEMRAKFSYLKKCLLRYRQLTGHGRGVTAVQIGIPERFSVVYTGNPNSHIPSGKLLLVINPRITKKSNHMLLYPEMCMSTVPIIAPTVRPAWIEFDYYDEQGNLQHWDTKSDTKQGRMLNRVFQHEIDHMDGIINIYRCNPKDLFLESDPKFYDNAKYTKVSA